MDNTLSPAYPQLGFEAYWMPPYRMTLPLAVQYHQQVMQARQAHLHEARMAALEQQTRIQAQLSIMKKSNKK